MKGQVVEQKNKNPKVIKRFSKYVVNAVAVLTATLAVLLFCSMKWMFDTWNHLDISELIYHLKSPMDGTNSGLITDYIIKCALPAVIVLAIATVVLIIVSKKNGIRKLVLIIISVSLLAICIEFIYTWNKLDIGVYLESINSEASFIDEEYVDPAKAQIVFPENKRNLIYIYLESMEVTYSDFENGGAYEDNYIPQLTELAKTYEDFSGDSVNLNGAYALNNTTWTMGAMFGHSTALPLTIPIDGSNMDTQDSFFPGIVAIGDVLEDEGYHNALLIGSKAVFGGRDLFYKEHGDYEILDYTYSIKEGQIPEGYYVWWGYEDEKLFQHAKEHLIEMSSFEEPFNLTILTADTHFEDGCYCEDCQDIYEGNQYANVITCSDGKVAEFVSWIQEQDFYENTTVVLVGDHLTMDADFCNEVDPAYGRRVYTAFINSAKEPELNQYRQYSTFDFFPTTISALGAEIEGNRLGLGTDLFSGEQTWVEVWGLEDINMKIVGKSKLIDKLAAEIDTDPDRLSEQQKMLNKQQGLDENGYAILTISPFNPETGFAEIKFSEWPKAKEECSYICEVWAKKNKKDMQTYQVKYLEEDTYAAYIHLDDFPKGSKIYNINIRAIYEDGTSELCGVSEIEISK